LQNKANKTKLDRAMSKRYVSKWIGFQDAVLVYKPGIDWAQEGSTCGECGRRFKGGEQHWLLDLVGSGLLPQERKKKRPAGRRSKARESLEAPVCKKCFPEINGKILDKSE
jgi:hypothetical protein